MKAPNSKFQVPNKSQATISKLVVGAWVLELLWNLELGVWSFS
jgi:hypothetical protein